MAPRTGMGVAAQPDGGAALQRHFATSDELCAYVRATAGPAVGLSFSAGKDAIAAWIKLRKHFERVVPYYLYLVPGLHFVEETLAYFEDVFETPILRLPSPQLSRMLRGLVLQSPERCRSIEAAKLPALSYDSIERHVRERGELGEDAFIAIGTRAADSPVRGSAVRRYGALNPTRRTFAPVFDWRLDDVIGGIAGAGIHLPIDYDVWGMTFDGIDHRFTGPLRERFPDDYETLERWFPLVGLDAARRGEAVAS